ncbi:unnamed protein product [Alopecurus aequalis]
MATAAAMAPPARVRVGLVLDLKSDVGRERRACVSEALHDFGLKHPSYATPVELLVRDSPGDLATSTLAAEDLINNSEVQAIVWAPETLTKKDHGWDLGHHHNHIPVIAFSSISPTSCAFWLQDPVTTSEGHQKFGITLGSDSITILNLETDRTQNKKLDTRRKMQGCSGKELKIAVPTKDGFYDFVSVIDPISKKENITGYSIDIFEAAMKNLLPRPCYKFIIFSGPYDELVRNVSLGVYDAAVGDVTITAERATAADFTMPYTQSGVYMLVLAEDEPNTISWTFVKPLNGGLWFATIAFFFYTGLVVWMIELPRNQEYQGSSLRQCTTALYFSFSTLTFSQGQIIRSPLSKIVVVIWCFVVLILVQSYTASLSSMLTAKKLRPFVKDLDQLRKSGDFVGYQHDSFVGSLLMNHSISESRLRNYTTKEDYAKALRLGSKYGGVSAIVDEIPYITSFLSEYKSGFRMLGSIYRTPGFAFAFHKGSPLVQNLSIAILNLEGGNEGSHIEAKWFGTSSPLIGDDTVPNTDPGPLTFQNFSGLFLITGSISSLMLLISIARWVYAKYAGLRKADMESVSYTDVDEDTVLLQNGMVNNPSPDQHPHTEAGNESLRGNRVNRENARDGAPSPVQKNGMNGGSSVPAEHIQIELSTR